MRPRRGHVDVHAARPVHSMAMEGNVGWQGIPGYEHIPPTSDPAFQFFLEVVVEWRTADVEFNADLTAAAVQVARLRAQKAAKERADRAVREARAAELAVIPPPGAFGDAKGGVVYYARRGNWVKIGTTTNLRARMQDVMPDEVMAVEPGSYRLERELHYAFADIRLDSSCEYFRLTDKLRDHIATVLERCGPPPANLRQFNDYENTAM